MKKLGLLMVACTFVASMLSVNAIDIITSPIGGMLYQDAGTNYSHDIQLMNRQRREFENSVDYKTQKRRQEADQQVQDTFSRIQNGTNAASGMEFTQGEDGSIIIKQAE